MTCRFSVWPVLLQADLFHTMTWVSLQDKRHVLSCVSGSSWSLKQEVALKVMMIPRLHCELLPADQKISWWARVKYHAWGPVHNMGNYFPPWSSFLPLLRNIVGFPSRGQAALHPSPSPWSQPGKERKVQIRLCRRRGFREAIHSGNFLLQKNYQSRCVYRRNLLERMVLPPGVGASTWVSAANQWQASQSTGRATEAERVCRNSWKH